MTSKGSKGTALVPVSSIKGNNTNMNVGLGQSRSSTR